MAAADEIEGVINARPGPPPPLRRPVFVDMTIEVDRNLSFERTHAIAESVEGQDPGPRPRRGRRRPHRSRARSSGRPGPAHPGHRRAEPDPASTTSASTRTRTRSMSISISRSTTTSLLHQAHDLATHVETGPQGRHPDHRPRQHPHRVAGHGRRGRPGRDGRRGPPRRADQTHHGRRRRAGCCHNILIRRQGERLAVSLHCGFDPDLPVIEAHRLSSRIEEALKMEIPAIEQVLVHTEPEASRADGPRQDADDAGRAGPPAGRGRLHGPPLHVRRARRDVDVRRGVRGRRARRDQDPDHGGRGEEARWSSSCTATARSRRRSWPGSWASSRSSRARRRRPSGTPATWSAARRPSACASPCRSTSRRRSWSFRRSTSTAGSAASWSASIRRSSPGSSTPSRCASPSQALEAA